MDIDEILERHYTSCKAYNSVYKDSYFKATYNHFIKETIKEIVKETLRMAADGAKVKTTTEVDIDGYPTYFSIVDKESITNAINKIKL